MQTKFSTSVAGEFVLSYLKSYHTSEDKAIKGKQLCRAYCLRNRDLRNAVASLRQDGHPICSSNAGYWYSTREADIRRTIKRLKEQVKNMNRTIAGLEKVEVTKDEKEIG